MRRVKEVALEDQPRVVLTLLALVLAVNMFLFAVAYSNASFAGVERSIPDPFQPAKISQQLDESLNIVADNLKWSTTTAVGIMQPKIVAMLGLEDYQYGAPVHSSLQPQVLGASTVNPAYADLVSQSGIQPIPQLSQLLGGIFSQ